jgi:valyl-tRNA synthetase
MIQLPKQYIPKEIESKWRARWQEMGIYRWDPARARNETFVVDSPPPTVSGSLHVGHVFSYTHQDLMVAPAPHGRNEYLLPYGVG